MKFAITSNRRDKHPHILEVHYDSGWILHIAFGVMHYSSNMSIEPVLPDEPGPLEFSNAEIWIDHPEKNAAMLRRATEEYTIGHLEAEYIVPLMMAMMLLMPEMTREDVQRVLIAHFDNVFAWKQFIQRITS